MIQVDVGLIPTSMKRMRVFGHTSRSPEDVYVLPDLLPDPFKSALLLFLRGPLAAVLPLLDGPP